MGKSTYTLQFRGDGNTVNQMMQSYLSANRFMPYEKNNEQYFRAGDAMVGYRGLTYSITNQTITINAWIEAMIGNVSLENSSLNIMSMNFRNSLSTLFKEIENINEANNMQTNINIQSDQAMNQNNNQINSSIPQNSFAQTFQNENLKKKETMGEIGFWLSIFGLISSFFGVAMGLVVYILDFYFASQGLKTRKKGKAIATIVLSIISIIITVLELIIST